MDLESFSPDHLKFKHPSSAIIGGPSQSGKTYFVRALLKDFRTLIHPPRETLNCLWAHGQAQEIYRQPIMARGLTLRYKEGLPNQEQLEKIRPDILVIDDLMQSARNDPSISDLFIKKVHHMRISVIFIVQNLFLKGTEMRTISLNATYFILMKTARDRQQISSLGRQIYPGKGRQFISVYEDATSRPFGYLVVDLHPTTPDHLRLRTRIFSSETPTPYNQLSLHAPFIYALT